DRSGYTGAENHHPAARRCRVASAACPRRSLPVDQRRLLRRRGEVSQPGGVAICRVVHSICHFANHEPIATITASPRAEGLSMHPHPVALVTGGSRGIGRGICVELARHGYTLAVNYAGNEEAARETQALLGAGVSSLLCRGDIGDAADRHSVVNAVLETFGR